MHVHIGEKLPDKEWAWRSWPGAVPRVQTAEQFIEKMDRCKPKIDKALIFADAVARPNHELLMKDNDYILSIVEEYPDRFIGAPVIDVSWREEAIQEIHRFIDAGFHIIKMRFTSYRFHANSKAGQRIFAEIEKLGALPVVHSDWTNFSNPLVIADLAMMFPDMKMILQHFGEYLSRDALSASKKADNIYVDTSALAHPKNVTHFINEVSPNRIMFASDTFSIRGGCQPQDALNRILCLDLPTTHENKVLGENAVALLKSMGVKI